MAVGSFSTGLSGLSAHSTYLSVIGNNLANLNTVGYKASVVRFADLVSQRIGSTSMNPTQVGLGVGTSSVSPVFSQGSIDNAREASNVAIEGSGFFLVEDENGSTAYTRAGDFTFDKDGNLVTPDGWRVQGYTQMDPATGGILATGNLNDIKIPSGALREPMPTTSFGTTTNLDADATAGPPPSTFSTSVEVYDALGAEHVLTIAYTSTGPGAWNYVIQVPGEEASGGTPGTPSQVASGSLRFNANGVLDPAGGVNGGAPADVAFTTPAWSNGAAPSTMSWDIVDANGLGMITGYASPSSTSSKTQNGSAAGQISDINVMPDGSIVGVVSAGESVVIGQLALANFNNPKGLIKIGANRYAPSESAGLRNIGEPGTGGRGKIIGSALESSNVDIALEFTQMILAQRGYQANAKTITVSDELLVETLQLKR
jgi:flagellar hook protein FlgE